MERVVRLNIWRPLLTVMAIVGAGCVDPANTPPPSENPEVALNASVGTGDHGRGDPLNQHDAESCGEKVPRVKLGSFARYAGQGNFALPSIGATSLVWWGPELNGLWPMGDGDELLFAVDRVPSTHWTEDGGKDQTVHATVWAARGDNGQRLPVADQWISMTDGHMVANAYRHVYSWTGDPAGITHDLRVTRINNPGLLLATMPRMALAGPIFNAPGLDSGAGYWDMQYQIRSSSDKRGDSCAWIVRVETLLPQRQVGHTMEATFEAGVPWPIAFAMNYFRNGEDGESRIEGDKTHYTLLEHKVGGGAPLPSWRPPYEPREMEAISNEVAAAQISSCNVAYSFRAMKNAVRDDDASSAWFRVHPDAVPIYVKYANGEPNSTDVGAPVGEWTVTWADAGAALQTTALRTRPVPLVEVYEDSVTAEPSPDFPPPDEARPIGLFCHRLHSVMQSDDLTIDCWLTGSRSCSGGSHKATGEPYAGPRTSAGFFNIGLRFSEPGMHLFGVQTFDESNLGPPVAYPV